MGTGFAALEDPPVLLPTVPSEILFLLGDGIKI